MAARVPKGEDPVSNWFSPGLADTFERWGVIRISEVGRLLNDSRILTRAYRAKCVRIIWNAYVNQEAIDSFAEDTEPIPTLPATPTGHSPGSTAKVQELRRRLEQGEELHHESDNQYKDRP